MNTALQKRIPRIDFWGTLYSGRAGGCSGALFSSTNLGTEPNQEFLNLILKPRIVFLRLTTFLVLGLRIRSPNIVIFSWLGLVLG